jgi:hypothetical protein
VQHNMCHSSLIGDSNISSSMQLNGRSPGNGWMLVTDDRLGALACGGFDLEQGQIASEELVTVAQGARVALLVHLAQSGRTFLGSPAAFRTGRDNLHDVVPLTQHGIDDGEDTNSERSAGQAVDGAAAPLMRLRRTRYDVRATLVRVISCVTREDGSCLISLSGLEPPVGIEPTTCSLRVSI